MHAAASTTRVAELAQGPDTAAKARFWDKLARKYAADPVADPIGYERSLARTREFLRPNQRVLEIGCGTGSTALRLAEHAASLVASDISPEMIAIAREKLAAAPQPKLEFVVADADAPLGGGARYDVVLAFNILHLVSDLDATLRGVWEALDPGGLLISKTGCISDMSPLVGRVMVPLMRLFGKAPHVVLDLRSVDLAVALTRQGFEILAFEFHAAKGRDFRPYVVARKPA
jgi:2-polyprenyl-3-methyl-5-hydroxy-6-metoxy-1,4-benzoquinol methylase